MFNNHCHTDLSYCSEGGMTLDFIADSVKNSPELDGLAITDHSFAIYFPKKVAWSWEYMLDSSVFDKFRDRGNEILEKHLQDISAKKKDKLVPGIELELMHDGRFTVDPDLLKKVDLIIGSVHWLDIPLNPTENEILGIWENYTIQLLDSGIHILGHPFRWLSTKIPAVTEKVIKKIVKAATEKNVALELNSHFEIDTDITMLREIIEQDAMVSFATDAHRQSEIADFSYHMELLKKANISMNDLNVFTPVKCG
jgi:histidinol phosphatase-like PHP family hydrolase